MIYRRHKALSTKWLFRGFKVIMYFEIEFNVDSMNKCQLCHSSASVTPVDIYLEDVGISVRNYYCQYCINRQAPGLVSIIITMMVIVLVYLLM